MRLHLTGKMLFWTHKLQAAEGVNTPVEVKRGRREEVQRDMATYVKPEDEEQRIAGDVTKQERQWRTYIRESEHETWLALEVAALKSIGAAQRQEAMQDAVVIVSHVEQSVRRTVLAVEATERNEILGLETLHRPPLRSPKAAKFGGPHTPTDAAATVIQKNWRGHVGRGEAARRRELDHAGAYAERCGTPSPRHSEVMDEEGNFGRYLRNVEGTAATAIQARWRGHSTRSNSATSLRSPSRSSLRST
eukprot:NODE_3239_length_923_cov_51.968593_g3218_i0.p1 GENE.NODE_3239_length_923_cov_51.968593_g3218_i0~~NODE_3239_length_923_cov_51.968593_g3218_i0.p1  ORF type:complete len:289 (+),score=66.21 NODE_3239_length_923_cov_51.968593_g3218_i0:125-868(+)